ncbi:MAG: glycosyltransferase family 2 protein [Lachnospiraceae bacterium]|nr:glycosyltransferase family 2 protein [Lachnospiraceae bacterium]
MKTVDIIVPCYNEADGLDLFYEETEKAVSRIAGYEFSYIFINDGSRDGSLEVMRRLSAAHPRVHYISFSRNFGKEAGMYAGLTHSTGDYVIIMDADLQHPPALIPQFVKAIEEGHDCAAACRSSRTGEKGLRSFLSGLFYKFSNAMTEVKLPQNAVDFRMMSRKMVDAICSMSEVERFSKGIFAWVGFRTVWIPFHNRERVAGKTKLPMSSAFRYAMRGITAFSTVPLLISSIIGILFCLAAVVYAVVTIVKQLITHEASPGYPSLMVVILLGFGLILLMLGIIGQYLSQMYLEIKHRPKYIIKETSLSEPPED